MSTSKNNPNNRKTKLVDVNVKPKYKTMSFWNPKHLRKGKR